MISVLSFKSFTKGSLLGFFTLRYHGLSIQNCRLMAGNDGGQEWFAFPSIKGEADGKTKYFEIMALSNIEREAVRALVLAELRQQGHLDRDADPRPTQRPTRQKSGRDAQEDSLYPHTEPSDDDIPF